MRRFARHPWVLYIAMMQHGIWALLLLVSENGLHTAPMSAFIGLGRWGAFAALSVITGMAIVGSRYGLSRNTGLLLVLPQQAALVMSAVSVAGLIAGSHYADGVIRPWEFIAADQSGGIILAVMHTGAIIDRYSK